MTSIDGTYSIAASAVAGTSLAVCVIKEGRLFGNDVGGARYDGSVTVEGEEISFRISFTTPPEGELIWGADTGDSWQTRTINHGMTIAEFQSGKPIFKSSEGMYLIFTRVPDEWAAIAGPEGFSILSNMLANADRAWKARDAG